MTEGNANVHTKTGVSNPEEEECRSDVSEAARSAAAAENTVRIKVSIRILVGVFCGVGRRTGDRHVGHTG